MFLVGGTISLIFLATVLILPRMFLVIGIVSLVSEMISLVIGATVLVR